MGNCLSCSKLRHRRYQMISILFSTLTVSSCGLSCPSCLSRQMKQQRAELAEEEMTDLRTGAEGKLLGSNLGLTRNSSAGLFETTAAAHQQSTSPRWSPLRWSREAEGRLRGGGEEEEEGRLASARLRADESLSSGVVWLEVNTSLFFLHWNISEFIISLPAATIR